MNTTTPRATTRQLGITVRNAENAAEAARSAFIGGSYTAARTQLDTAERLINTATREYGTIVRYTPTTLSHIDRADKLAKATAALRANIQVIDSAYASATGYTHGAPDNWTPAAPAAPAESTTITSVIVFRAAGQDTPDKVVIYTGGGIEEHVRKHYPAATNIQFDQFDHPDTENGYYADIMRIRT